MRRRLTVQPHTGLFGIGLALGFGLACANDVADTLPLILDDPTAQAYANFGSAVAGVGDVDGDGIADLLVGAPNQGAGRAFLFNGSDGALIRALDDPPAENYARFGASVADAGDIDGDGVSDLAVGAFFQTVGINAGQGQVFLFSGADGTLLRTLDDPTAQAYANFGSAVAGVGDVDGDGVADLLVGARYQAPGGNTAQGQAFVFSGADGGLLLTLDDPVPLASANFGYALAGVGDVNGDGTPDLLVGAPNQGQGKAFVFSGTDGTLLHTLDTPTPLLQSGLGAAVAGAGDIDHDGVPDLLVGAPYQDVGVHPMQGQALVFSGADGGLLLTLDDPTAQDYVNFGSAVAGVGDVNGDGTPDLAAAAAYQTVGDVLYKGQVWIFSGADGGLLQTLDDPTTPQGSGGFFGNAIAAVGGPSPGGTPGLLVGAPYQSAGGNTNQGQAYLFSLSGGGATEVVVNIRPGSNRNRFSCNDDGILPVAILSGSGFDATAVDPATVSLTAPAGSTAARAKTARPDVNGDGLRDLLVFFQAGRVARAVGCPLPARTSVSVTISGETTLGAAFEGTDSLVIVGHSKL